MSNPIVTVNVSQTQAPIPSNLQKTGALVSQGGTTLATGSYSLLTQLSDLAPLLSAALAITSLAWASTFGGTVTATATANHGVAVGQQFVTTIAGAVPAGYNGTYLATATGAATFTYYLAADPGSETTPGTYTPRNVGELTAMATTFFSQGAQQGVYVLELGAGEPAAAIANLSTFITNNDQFFYSYLVPRNWDGVSSFLSLIATLEATTSKTYFWVTTTLQNYALYTETMKNVIAMIEAPVYGTWPSNAITNATYSTGSATATTTTAHGVKPGDYFTLTGILPTGYDGTFRALPGTTGSSLVYAVPADPSSYVSDGTLVASSYASAGIPATEFSLASAFWVALNYAPSTVNRVTPFSYSFLFGVTAFPQRGNAALVTTLKNANINIVGTGAEGGISGTILLYGRNMDGRPFNYWYAVDWMQVNIDIDISNAIINGSNNPINPLYYNQQGINSLETVAGGTGSRAITYGLALGSVRLLQLEQQPFLDNMNAGVYNGNVVVNAIPFRPYSVANPSDYRIGRYAGMSMLFTPLRGFESIVFNINVTDFVASAV